MNDKESYKILKAVRLDYITYAPGDIIELHPRQAVFLLTTGTIEKVGDAA